MYFFFHIVWVDNLNLIGIVTSKLCLNKKLTIKDHILLFSSNHGAFHHFDKIRSWKTIAIEAKWEKKIV